MKQTTDNLLGGAAMFSGLTRSLVFFTILSLGGVRGFAQQMTPLTVPATPTRLPERVVAEPARVLSAAERATIAAAEEKVRERLDTLRRSFADACNRMFLYEAPEVQTIAVSALESFQDPLERLRTEVAGGIAEIAKVDAVTAKALSDELQKVLPAWEPAVAQDPAERLERRKALVLFTSCAARIDEEVEESTDDAENAEVPRQLHYRLMQQHYSYKRLKNWLEYLAVSTKGKQDEVTGRIPREDVSARAAIRTLDQNVHRRLKRHDLLQSFSASLVSGPVFVDSGQPTEQTAEAEGSKAQALSHIVFQSKHWGDETQTLGDFSIVGKFGLQPVLTLVKPASSDEEAEPTGEAGGANTALSTVHDRALHWNIGIAGNWGLQDTAEVSGVFRVGGSYLIDERVLVDRIEGGSYIAAPIRNESGRTAWMWEAALEYNLFDDPLEIMHVLQGFVSPKFHTSTGFRRDARFNRTGDLATFDSPQDRWFFKFFLDAVKVVDQRKLGDKQPTFNFGFGVEYERAAWWSSGQRIPAGTRIFVRGDVNLLRAFKGEEPAATEESKKTKNGSGEGLASQRSP